MPNRLSLEQVYVLVLMEFQAFGLPSIRNQLADQCAYEVVCALEDNPNFSSLAPEVYAWRTDTTDDGRQWFYPQEELCGFSYCKTDSRHVGGSEFEELGMAANPYKCLLAVKRLNVFDLRRLVSEAVYPYLTEEVELRVEFERDLRAAKMEVADRYKERVKERFLSQKGA